MFIDSKVDLLLLDSPISENPYSGKAERETRNQMLVTQNMKDATTDVESVTGVQRREPWPIPGQIRKASWRRRYENWIIISENPPGRRETGTHFLYTSLFKTRLFNQLRDLNAVKKSY